MTDQASQHAVLAVSAGDPSGIGPEVIAKAWIARKTANLPCFFAVGDPSAFAAIWDGPVAIIGDPGEARDRFDEALPLLPVSDGTAVTPGKPDLEGARCALEALEIGAGLARSGTVHGLVTGPIAKAQLQRIGFTYPGQTEFVAERCGVSRQNVVMMLAGPSLRVVPLTIHIALADVPEALSTDLIVNRARTTAKGLTRNFGITNPRLAMTGLNPHAGEDGTMGREEIDIIAPAIAQLRDEGIDVTGPLPADTLFHPVARARYDAVLCQYHDQALIPIKALHFDDAVNITLGLPIVRTSPDHGTAFDIAGQDRANPGSMIAAIAMAGSAWRHRCAMDG